MAPVHKVAVCQFRPEPLAPEKNFTKASNFIRSAAAQGARLAVLPEYHLNGWVPEDPRYKSLCAQWKDYLQRYQALAKEWGICIVPGTLVQTPEGTTAQNGSSTEEHDPGTDTATDHARGRERGIGLENVAYFISNTGEIIGTYVKKNLWGAGERAHLASSGRDAHPVFDTPLGRVGLLICWDLAFPEAWRELIAQGAKLIVVPTFWKPSDCTEAGLAHNPAAEALFIDSTLTSRCFENTCAVVFCNAYGLSQICVPFVGPLVRLGNDADRIAVADVDMQTVEDAEECYWVRKDLASEGWHYDYRNAGATSDDAAA